MKTLFELRKDFKTVVFQDLDFLRFFHIRLDHFRNHRSESVLGFPTKNALSLRGIAKKKVDFRRAEEFGIDRNENLSGFRIYAHFVDAFALPFDIDAYFFERPIDEIADGIGLTHGDDEVFGLVLLEHKPHSLYIILGMTPVALGIKIADFHLFKLTKADLGNRAGNLASDEVFSAKRGFVVEKKAIAREHAVAFAVVSHDPVAVKLSYAVGASRMEGGFFSISIIGHVVSYATEHFRRGRLVKTGLLFQSVHADGLKEVQYAHRVGLSGIFGHVETQTNVRLCGKVVHFVRADLREERSKSRTIGNVTEVELNFVGFFPLKELVDARGIEKRSAAFEAMDFVPLVEKKFGKVSAVLAGDSGNESFFHFLKAKITNARGFGDGTEIRFARF